MTGFIKVTTRGIDRLAGLLKRIPKGAKKPALQAFSKYVVGNEAHGLKHYPPDRPSRYVRTYKLRGGWNYEAEDTKAYISNSVPYAPYPQGQPPTRVMQQRGWRGHMDVIFSNMAGGIRSAQAAVNEFVRSLTG